MLIKKNPYVPKKLSWDCFEQSEIQTSPHEQANIITLWLHCNMESVENIMQEATNKI